MITPIEVTLSSVPGQVKVAKMAATATQTVIFKLVDDRGQPVSLTGLTVKLRSRSGDLYGPVKFDLTGTILTGNQVQFTFGPPNTDSPGLFASEIGTFNGSNALLQTWPLHLQIEPSAWQTSTDGGPVLIPEVRLALLDVYQGTDGWPFSNLLNDVEFSDAEITLAIRHTVDLWNETPPPVVYYSTENFPYRYWWTRGTMAHLLQMAARRYMRNRLAYQAGGVSIDDQSKAAEYMQHAGQLLDEYKEWMLKEKVRINMESCWATGL